MRVRRNILLLACVIVAFALPALAGDVAGKWKAEFDTQVGVQKYTFDFKVEGEKLTGKASFERMGQKGETDLLEGRVSGDEISFVEKSAYRKTKSASNTEARSTAMKSALPAKVGDFATEQFVAKRVKE